MTGWALFACDLASLLSPSLKVRDVDLLVPKSGVGESRPLKKSVIRWSSIPFWSSKTSWRPSGEVVVISRTILSWRRELATFVQDVVTDSTAILLGAKPPGEAVAARAQALDGEFDLPAAAAPRPPPHDMIPCMPDLIPKAHDIDP